MSSRYRVHGRIARGSKTMGPPRLFFASGAPERSLSTLVVSMFWLFMIVPLAFGQNPEAVQCFVFDDDFANQEGPSDAIFISGRSNEQGKACIPGGQFGHCHKWFG